MRTTAHGHLLVRLAQQVGRCHLVVVVIGVRLPQDGDVLHAHPPAHYRQEPLLAHATHPSVGSGRRRTGTGPSRTGGLAEGWRRAFFR